MENPIQMDYLGVPLFLETLHEVGIHKVIAWIYPPPRIPVANEGLGWDSLLKMFHNPGGDCYWVGGRPKL